jgi:hypothetical protein
MSVSHEHFNFWFVEIGADFDQLLKLSIPRCGALSLLQKPLHYRGVRSIASSTTIKYLRRLGKPRGSAMHKKLRF